MKLKLNTMRIAIILIASIFISSCEEKTKEKELNFEVDITTLEKEIESRLREYESHLKKSPKFFANLIVKKKKKNVH